MMGKGLVLNAVSRIATQTSRKPTGDVRVHPCMTIGSQIALEYLDPMVEVLGRRSLSPRSLRSRLCTLLLGEPNAGGIVGSFVLGFLLWLLLGIGVGFADHSCLTVSYFFSLALEDSRPNFGSEDVDSRAAWGIMGDFDLGGVRAPESSPFQTSISMHRQLRLRTYEHDMLDIAQEDLIASLLRGVGLTFRYASAELGEVS